jgi:hypothetical protein
MSESEEEVEAARPWSDSECADNSEERAMSGVSIEMGEPKEKGEPNECDESDRSVSERSDRTLEMCR